MKLLLTSLLVIFAVASAKYVKKQTNQDNRRADKRDADKGDADKGDAKKDGEWSYDKQDQWPEVCQTGRHQSPISITEDVEDWVEWGPLKMTDDRPYAMSLGSVKIKNTGHGFAIKSDDFKHCFLHGGGLDGEYVMDSFHFHWGQPGEAKYGSEHVIHGMTWELEGHFIHYHSDFDNLTDAVHSGQSDALAVVGVMYERVIGHRPSHFVQLSSMLAHVAYNDKPKPTGDTTMPTAMPKVDHTKDDYSMKDDDKMWKESDALYNHYLSDFLPEDMEHFYRYDGSLTTPDCNQVVRWTLMEQPMKIGAEELKHFEAFKDKHGEVMSNYRETQPLHGRRVYHNEKPMVGGAANQKPVFAMLLIAVCIGKLFT